MLTAVVAIFVFGLLVFFHELGHFGVAKYVGIKVHEFALGMGPRIAKFTKGETDYSIRALPIGGYVKMEGEDEASNDQRSFSKKTVGQRVAVIIAGPLMNFVLAIVLFTIIFYTVSGMATTVIDEIIPESPAQVVGIQPKDEITYINDIKINNWNQLQEKISSSGEELLKITILRNGETLEKTIKPEIDDTTGRAMIGIIPATEKSFVLAVKGSFSQTGLIFKEMLTFFGSIFRREATTADVVGPVGIINLVGEASRAGWLYVLHLAALISINLGIINLLPIPALDGSRIMFLGLEFLRGRPVDPEKEAMVHIVGFALLMALMIMITYKDILTFY